MKMTEDGLCLLRFLKEHTVEQTHAVQTWPWQVYEKRFGISYYRSYCVLSPDLNDISLHVYHVFDIFDCDCSYNVVIFKIYFSLHDVYRAYTVIGMFSIRVGISYYRYSYRIIYQSVNF